MLPTTLFGRTALVIALVSFAFQFFTIAVITWFALMPLGRHATSDLAALMIDSAESWAAEPPAERPWLQERLFRTHRLQVQDPPGQVSGFTRQLPYFQLLETALSARSGRRVELGASHADDGERWYWADLPVDGATVRVGFPDSRVDVKPWLAMVLILSVGTIVALITSAWLAHWLIAPLSRLATAARGIGQGRRPEPLPETGPAELAALAREFNRTGEQVQELLANRTTLLAGISHDLRTPLTRISLALGMLSEKPERELFDRAMRDVEGMNELIARCLEVGRDFAEQDAVDFDLCDLLAEVAGEYTASGADIRGRKGPECRVRARPLALRRILSNLVDNALRYGGGQPVDIEYRLVDGRVDICVLDRGPGVPEEEREAVFRPFHRLEPSRSSRTGGSGLGLAIVSQLASANGWTVDLAPRENGGTTACVRVPLDRAAAIAEN
ncbi:MAG: HAMP domain-containing protein [Gemmatimonadales bacterium]|nr:HAMP domain-containing protein [Gemmatimonadales bacterium]